MKSYLEQFHGDEDENTICVKNCQDVCNCDIDLYYDSADVEREIYLDNLDNMTFDFSQAWGC